MRDSVPSRLSFKRAASTLILIPCLSFAIAAQTLGPTERTARHFDSIRNSPPELLAFLLRLPKGGDLHSHLSGAVYAESYVRWAADVGACINTITMVASVPPCDVAITVPATNALSNSILYRQIIDAWSMRNWKLSGQSGHDHFYDTFGKFGAATFNRTGEMLAEVVSRAAQQNVSYVELMLTPSFTASQLGNQVGWDGNFESTLAKLKSNGIEGAAAEGIKNLQEAEALKDRLLNCRTPQPDPGCRVDVRYIAQVSRASNLGAVFAQMTTGFILANTPDSKVVAINLVQAEDAFASLANFSIHMQMLHFLKPLYPRAHLTLQAGELAPGMVPPEALTFHVHDSITVAGAERIGLGVDIMHESKPEELLREMARRNILVETCLSSNVLVLGISGPDHPLTTYLKYGVPIALATDDEGVLRSEMSREYLRAVEEHGLRYLQLKMIARNSLEYAFVAGASLWSDAKKFSPVAACRADLRTGTSNSSSCRQLLQSSEKARLQWELEQDFQQFERNY